MVLTINKNEIDFTLENEKSLQDIVIEVDKFLKANYQIIEKLYVNSQDYSNKSIEIPLEGIDRVDIETTSIFEIRLHNIDTVILFFDDLKKLLSSWSKEGSLTVKDEIDSVYKILSETLSHNNSTPDNTYSLAMEDMFKKTNFFTDKLTEGYSESFIKLIDNIIILLNERKSEIINPKIELIASIKALEDSTESLEDVSILLQTNKETEASEIINKFVSLFQKVIRLIEINQIDENIIEQDKLGNFISDLNDILRELLEGYESQDVVLIGDILEYEITPKVEYLHNLIVKGS